MRNLVSRSPKVVAALVSADDYHDYFGLLTSPRSGYNPQAAIELGVRWAADNDAFAFWKRGETYDPAPFCRALKRWKPYAAHCLFVNAPDVLTNAERTLEQFWPWRDVVHAHGLPVAFTVQNGVENYPPPFGSFEALFIGSTNQVKYSAHVAGLVAEARRRGLHVHNGRVNTPRAVMQSKKIGCSSFDGTKFTHDVRQILRVLPYQKDEIQPFLFDLEAVG